MCHYIFYSYCFILEILTYNVVSFQAVRRVLLLPQLPQGSVEPPHGRQRVQLDLLPTHSRRRRQDRRQGEAEPPPPSLPRVAHDHRRLHHAAQAVCSG